MTRLYSFIIHLYHLLIQATSLFNPKAKLWVKGRKNWRKNLANQINTEEEWIWVHTSSLGEYEDCAEVLSEIRKIYTSHKIILTFFSPTGIIATKGKDVADLIFYLPLDTKSNAREFLNIVQPKFILFSRSELWYNFLTEIKKRELPVFLIAALVSPNSRFIKWPQKIIYKNCYSVFTQIYCQNKQTMALLQKHFTISKCTVAGNSRIDRIYQSITNKSYSPPIGLDISEFVGNSFCVISGSCLDRDEKMILSAIKKLNHLPIKWIIVPHEIHEKKIEKQLKKLNPVAIRYSDFGSLTKDHTILYIDFVGGLKYLFKYGNLAIIGGGFNSIGIHNIIEPTFHGIPTTFGPNHRNYPEAIELLNLGYSSIHNNSIELEKKIEYDYNNPLSIEKKKCIQNYVISKLGTSDKIVNDIKFRVPPLN